MSGALLVLAFGVTNYLLGADGYHTHHGFIFWQGGFNLASGIFSCFAGLAVLRRA